MKTSRCASELIDGDGNGNDDGLCESYETCVAAPSYGAYQDEGKLVDTCTFTDGVVTGVTMMWFPVTGAP